MIVVRSPLRIEFAGGITDLPAYYKRHTGFMVVAAIDKYIYLTINERFGTDLLVRYSKTELVEKASQLEHPIFRECFDLLEMDGRSLELCSIADVPSGTGLGSSGSFTTALLKALHAFNKNGIAAERLAEQAFDIEVNRLNGQGGKVDQYIAAFGGIKGLRFLPDGRGEVVSLRISEDTLHSLEENLLLFFTGQCRSSSAVLEDHQNRLRQNEPKLLKQMHFEKENAFRVQQALESDNLDEFTRLLDEGWKSRKLRSECMTNSKIDEWYALGKSNGATCGYLVGAGGGGFLMFYAYDKKRLRSAMRQAGLQELRFRFDFEGTKLLPW